MVEVTACRQQTWSVARIHASIFPQHRRAHIVQMACQLPSHPHHAHWHNDISSGPPARVLLTIPPSLRRGPHSPESHGVVAARLVPQPLSRQSRANSDENS
jgi:hypothetical protein